jgi:hypothetical protein
VKLYAVSTIGDQEKSYIVAEDFAAAVRAAEEQFDPRYVEAVILMKTNKVVVVNGR